MLCYKHKYISIAKQGNKDEENEDNILVPTPAELNNEEVLKYAIADGATESSFSKEWSDLLVCCYKEKSFERAHVRDTIKHISEMWYAKVRSKELPWYAAQKAELGAFATFLGITICMPTQTYQAVAAGDCMLFHIRENNLFFSFPNVEEFNNQPSLISSNLQYHRNLEETFVYFQGSILPGDTLILATDALSHWLYQKQSQKPWLALYLLLNSPNYEQDFKDWLKDKIASKEIKNDDVSLIFIEIFEDNATSTT
ncbi:MAG: protein phosphatase 2C domain-containing protein [Bacteroidia bacterium]|nr:protein phosphatase 2C domain-containing protein [Bacteroidia bacterium]MDW8158376.1 protein phosphatase 2C domain-containing protein [Bacteroidia bacterium]